MVLAVLCGVLAVLILYTLVTRKPPQRIKRTSPAPTVRPASSASSASSASPAVPSPGEASGPTTSAAPREP